MSTAGLRSRGRMSSRQGRDIQGLLAMHDSESGTDQQERVAAEPPTARRLARPTTTTRRERARRMPAAPDEPVALPHRKVLAAWPDDWRERWGRRANDLEDVGFSWRDAEGRAFLEIWNQWRDQADVTRRN